MRRTTTAAAAFALVACGPASRVERVYDGHSVEGRAIEPERYTAFLRGALAEASGDLTGALAAYGAAAQDDPVSVEIWTRLGDVRCRLSVRDASADCSFARAIDLDSAYAPAWSAKARCLLARGDVAGARVAALRAAQVGPAADGASVLLAKTLPRASADEAAARRAFVALTVTARDPLVAWESVGAWAEDRGDVALRVRALVELARLAPSNRDAIARSAEDLAGAGELGAARAVASAAAEAEGQPLAGEPRRLAARLALDQSIAGRDEQAVRRRLTRVHVGLDEAAGRALLAGARVLAVALASACARADPAARGARLVLAAGQGEDLQAAASDRRPGDSPASAAAFVAFGVALLHATTAASARSALSAIAHEELVGGDDRVVRPAVELAWRGALAPETLPPEGMVELAALRGTLPPPSGEGQPLDARHAYLALALSAPSTPVAHQLAARLGPGAGIDPLVAAASALMDLAAGPSRVRAAASVLLARDPGDLVLAVTALHVAKRTGDADGARRAREALRAFFGERGASEE